MKIEIDEPGHQFVDVGNIRLTYIPAKGRRGEADWSGQDVIRFQAYRDEKTRALHRGAELPVADACRFLALVEGLCLLYRGVQSGLTADSTLPEKM